MAEAFKKTVMAIRKETTQGVPALPQSGGDFIALQPDWTMAPEFNNLDNEEMVSSIGRRAPIIGSEEPTSGGSHYLRGSGVEGQEAGYGPLLEAFFGARHLNATEYATAASSTVAYLQLGAGVAANFRAGQSVLIKDPVNGWRLRAIHSVDLALDRLHLSFNVPSAPGSGVDLGKSVHYEASNEDHPSLTLVRYVGNGGATEMVAGAMVTGFNFEATANELLNADFSLEALGYWFNGMFVVTGKQNIAFADDDDDFVATIQPGWYKGPHEIARAITNAMNEVADNETHLCEYLDSEGKFKFTASGTTLELEWTYGSVAQAVEFTLPSVAGSTGGDFGVFYDHLGVSWAYSLNKGGSDPQPTSALWTAIPSGRKVHVNISGGTDAASVAALVETALNGLSGKTWLADDSGGSGSLIVTNDVGGLALAPVVSDEDGSGAGSIAVSIDVAGEATSTAAVLLGFDPFEDLDGEDASDGYESATAQDWSAPFVPQYDAAQPLAVKHHEVMLGDAEEYVCFETDAISFSGSNTRTVRGSICAESGKSGATITEREGEITLNTELQRHEAKLYDRFKEGDIVRFQYSFGTRTGGNWNPGFCGLAYFPTCKIVSFSIEDDEGVAVLNMTLQPVVPDSGEAEMHFCTN